MFNERSYAIKRRLPLIGILCLLLLLIISGILFVPSIKGTENPSSRHSSLRFDQTATPDIATITQTPTSLLTPTPLFVDDFIESSKDWALSQGDDTSGYLRTMVNNQLVLSDANRKILIESLPTSATFSDFSLTTTFTLLKGDGNDSVGLYLRGDSNLDHDYRID